MLFPQRIGQICGVIFANVVSPIGMVFSWLLHPYMDRVTMALHSQHQMLQLIHDYQTFVRAYPLQTISGLLALLVIMLTLGFAYTLYMANLGGRIALKISKIFFTAS